jgi:hypothetical protein
VSTSSCKKDVESGTDNIIGSWIEPVYSDSSITFSKDILGTDDAYKITFKSDGRLVERKNAGDCGTPPISYADFDGTWSLNDSTITINVDFWGGTADYQWRIISVSSSELKVAVVNQTYNFVNF